MRTHTSRTFIVAAAVLVLAAGAGAQKSAKPAAKTPAKAKAAPAREPAASQPSLDLQPSPLTPHLLVEVVLKNGAVFQGVALDGKLYEQAQGPGYESIGEAQKDAIGAGIRLWYYRNLDGFVFLWHRDNERVTVKHALSESEMASIRHRAREAKIAGGRGGSPADSQSAPRGLEALDPEQRRLIAAYPPKEGWSIERYEAVQRQLVLENVQPTPAENAWIAVYPDWVQAYRLYYGIPSASDSAAAAPRKAAAPKSGKAAPAPSAKKTAAPVSPQRTTPRAAVDAQRKAAPAPDADDAPPTRGRGD
jgi:hypothetical protein